jgi:hypothetical protein
VQAHHVHLHLLQTSPKHAAGTKNKETLPQLSPLCPVLTVLLDKVVHARAGVSGLQQPPEAQRHACSKAAKLLLTKHSSVVRRTCTAMVSWQPDRCARQRLAG